MGAFFMSMEKVNIFNSGDLIEFSESKKNRFKKQIIRFGKWFHESANDISYEMNKKKAEIILDNFKARKIENVPVLKGHAGKAEAERNPDLIAGYVEDLEIDSDGINAVIEIKDEVVDKIGTDYKNVSVAVKENYVDHETGNAVGDVLEHVALVIEPYIKKINPEFIAFSEEYSKENDINILFLNNNNMAKTKKTVEMTEIEEPKVEETTEEPTKEVEETTEEVVEEATEETTEEVTEETTEEAVEKEDEENKETSVEMSEIESLKQQLDEANKKLAQEKQEKISNRVSVLMSEGKVLPSQKEEVMALLSNEDSIWFSEGEQKSISSLFESFIEKQPKVIEFSELGTKTGGSLLSSEEEEQMKRLRVSKEARDAYLKSKEN